MLLAFVRSGRSPGSSMAARTGSLRRRSENRETIRPEVRNLGLGIGRRDADSISDHLCADESAQVDERVVEDPHLEPIVGYRQLDAQLPAPARGCRNGAGNLHPAPIADVRSKLGEGDDLRERRGGGGQPGKRRLADDWQRRIVYERGLPADGDVVARNESRGRVCPTDPRRTRRVLHEQQAKLCVRVSDDALKADGDGLTCPHLSNRCGIGRGDGPVVHGST